MSSTCHDGARRRGRQTRLRRRTNQLRQVPRRRLLVVAVRRPDAQVRSTAGTQATVAQPRPADVDRQLVERPLRAGAVRLHPAEDELRLVRGRDVEVLSKDKRDCGDKNWWMGRSGHQCGIFPSSFVVEKTSLDRVNILLPLEIDFEELTQKAFIGRGGFGKVFLCAWRGEEVNIATTVTIYEQVCPKLTWKQAASPSMVAPWQTDSYPRVQWFKRIFQVALMCTSM